MKRTFGKILYALVSKKREQMYRHIFSEKKKYNPKFLRIVLYSKKGLYRLEMIFQINTELYWFVRLLESSVHAFKVESCIFLVSKISSPEVNFQVLES